MTSENLGTEVPTKVAIIAVTTANSASEAPFTLFKKLLINFLERVNMYLLQHNIYAKLEFILKTEIKPSIVS